VNCRTKSRRLVVSPIVVLQPKTASGRSVRLPLLCRSTT
jgi:hypothetical protein